jgi:hypothetical protein
MFHFTVRELVMLTAMVALALGWGLDRLYTTNKLVDDRATIHHLSHKIEMLELNLKRLNPLFQPTTSGGSLVEPP